MAVKAYLALGSNLGNRQDQLEQALSHLRNTDGIQVEAVSSFVETEPMGVPPCPGGTAGQSRPSPRRRSPLSPFMATRPPTALLQSPRSITHLATARKRSAPTTAICKSVTASPATPGRSR